MRRLGPALLLAAAVGIPTAAHANGRFPDTIEVHFKPGDDTVIGLQATWGFMLSVDSGATWRWMCEEAVGFGGVYDPDYAFTSTGLLLATTTSMDGLRLTRDGGCTWTPAPAPLGDVAGSTFVSQIEVVGSFIYAAASDASGDSQIYRSADDGVQFAPVSNPGGGVDWWESLVSAGPDDPARLYLTGYNLLDGGFKERLLFRSDTDATTWVPLPVTDFTFGGTLADLQIAAVSPNDADVVFARVFQTNGTSIGDDLYRSTNAGASWTRVFQSGDDITAVVVRASGEVILTTRQSGVHTSSDGGVTFGAAIDGKTMNCLRERGDGVLFACSKSFPPDSMALGRGATFGTWEPLMTFDQIVEPVDCAAGTPQHDICLEMRWPGTVCQFGITDPDVQCVLPDAGPGPDAPSPQDPPKNCTDCSTGSPASTALVGLLVALPLARRRRRKR